MYNDLMAATDKYQFQGAQDTCILQIILYDSFGVFWKLGDGTDFCTAIKCSFQ